MEKMGISTTGDISAACLGTGPGRRIRLCWQSCCCSSCEPVEPLSLSRERLHHCFSSEHWKDITSHHITVKIQTTINKKTPCTSKKRTKETNLIVVGEEPGSAAAPNRSPTSGVCLSRTRQMMLPSRLRTRGMPMHKPQSLLESEHLR